MATYHLSLKNGMVGTAKNHAEYILRLGRFSDKARKEELKHQNSNLPGWANDAVEFFEKADIFERLNGRAYVEFEIALPNEMDLEENISMVETFINHNIGKDKVWSYAVHSKRAAFDDSQEQIHAHIMFSERIVTSEMEEALCPSKFFKRYNPKNPGRGGYKKDRRFSDRKYSIENLKKVRKDWEVITNKKYEEKNIKKRVSCETLKKQKEEAEKISDFALAALLDRQPQEHLGFRVTNIVRKAFKNKNINKDNLDDVLDEIYAISTKAFCLVIDQLEKEKKEIEYLKELKQREMINVNQSNDVDSICPDDRVIVKGSNIADIVNNIEEKLMMKAKENQEEIRKMKKLLFSEKQIGFLALSICTKGYSKRLMKNRRNLDKKKRELEEELCTLVDGNQPVFWQFDEKRKYEKQIDKVSNAITEIEEQLVIIRKEAQKINELMQEDSNKRKMISVINKLKERQKARIQYVKILENQQEKYKIMSDRCDLMLEDVKINHYYKVQKSTYAICNSFKHEMNAEEMVKEINNLKRLIATAEKEDELASRKQNNLKIKLGTSDRRSGTQFEV